MIDKVCRNTHWDDRFTCPACYTDHKGEVDQCSGCGAKLRCYVERVPESVCELVEQEDGADD